MKKLLIFALAFIFIGGGCSFKYNADWDTKDRAGANGPSATTTESDRPACNMENEEAYPELPCCGSLVPTQVDHAKTVCTKPSTSDFKPRVCAAPGEIVTVDTPNCCAGLDIVEKDNKFVCEPMK